MIGSEPATIPSLDQWPVSLPRYRITGELGRGGMGVVFAAEDREQGRAVALKVMNPRLLEIEGCRERFAREVAAVRAVENRHVVAILDSGEHLGLPFMVMPRLAGQTLEDFIQKRMPLRLADVVRIGRQIAEALQATHAVGILHRDIKPGNIMLEAPTGDVVVLDFGLAVRREDRELTQPGFCPGTVGYIAPERVLGQRGQAASDLYSLGMVLMTLVTGVSPDRRAVLPGELTGLLNQLVAWEPMDRPASAAAVVEAFCDMEKRLRLDSPLSPFPSAAFTPTSAYTAA